MKKVISEELDLVSSVLSWYPPSIARNDALRAIQVIRKETKCDTNEVKGPSTTNGPRVMIRIQHSI